MAKKRARKRPPAEGYSGFDFHGSYTSRAKAEAKARKVGGFMYSRKVTGQRGLRFIVMASGVPF